MTVEWAFETCMPQCAPKARHFLHPPVAIQGSAAEMVPVLLFLPRDAAAAWGAWPLFQGPGSCRAHTLGPAVLRTPGEPLVALFVALIVVGKLTPVPFPGGRAAIWCHLLGRSLPQGTPTPSSLQP